jgi:hypothetical protein
MPFDRQAKIKALNTLMEYSILIPEPNRLELMENIDKLSDEDIMNLGKILAFEHNNREKLDQQTVVTFLNSLSEQQKSNKAK